MSDVTNRWSTLGKTLAVGVATFALLGAPDIAFRLAGYDIMSFVNGDAIVTVAVLAILLTLMPSRWGRIAVIGFVSIGQLIWLGCLRYFGGVLRPDQLMLVVSEARDTTIGIMSELGSLLPVFLLVSAVAGALFFLHGRRIEAGVWRLPGAGLLLVILLVGVAGRWTFWRHAVIAFPGLQTASAIGTYHATIAAFRFALAPAKAAPGLKLHDQKVLVKELEEEPATVLVIMGESINPARLSLFGATADTSPNLHSWRSKPPPGMTFFPRIGFASGVATWGSVPSFIRTAFFPIEGERRGLNLFALARQNGFKSWYFSAQSQHFLGTAGGAPGAERVETEETNDMVINRIKDDYLVDLVRSVPADYSRRQFIFVHQRVNHGRYENNCSHVSDTVNIFKTDGLSVNDARRANYDNGLRCWDRNVAALVAPLVGRSGAVHVIITADHNELMGEDGLWGHLHPTIRNAAVPFILLTNRPESAVARQFRAMSPASFHNLSRIVAQALGVEIEFPEIAADLFYMNKTLPFGMAGYMEVQQLGRWRFKVRSFDRDGTEAEPRSVELLDLGAGEDYAQRSGPVSVLGPRAVNSTLEPTFP